MSTPTKHVQHYAYRNRDWILASGSVGCFSCCRIFPRVEINKWVDEGTTALCPHCKMDSVLPELIPLSVNTLRLLSVQTYGRAGLAARTASPLTEESPTDDSEGDSTGDFEAM